MSELIKNEMVKAETEKIYRALQTITDDNLRIQLRNKIVEMNIKLVSHVLKKFKPYDEDKFQNGCIGLIKAADTYKLDKKVPFASYACFLIERELHLAFATFKSSIEGTLNEEDFIRLDGKKNMSNGDTVEYSEIIWDEKAEIEMNQYIQENELEFVCSQIIKPCIAAQAARGRQNNIKTDKDMWQELEFLYIMDLIFLDSQKQRINLSAIAKQLGLSVTFVRNKHEKVMAVIFERMWMYMNLSFGELLERLRGDKRIPERLLCLDPGKTTGWCLFENGVKTAEGELPNCYDEKNVDVKPLMTLMERVQPDFIVYEDYKVYAHKLDRHTFSSVFTLRLIGVIETYCQMNDVKAHKQMATTAKNFCTDDKLKNWGMWTAGLKHTRDSVRHGCYFLLFFNKGKDIL